MFSVTFRYAVISLMDMAHSETGLRASSIARRHRISGRYLANVLGELRRLGLVTSHKGRNGGYYLSRQPDQITLLEIYQGLAGSGRHSVPTTDPDITSETGVSSTDRWLGGFERRWIEEMGRTTLEDLDHGSDCLEPGD